MLLYQSLACAIHKKNIKKSYKNNKFTTSDPTWNEKYKLPDGSNSESDIHDCFKYVIKKHKTVTDDASIGIYGNKTENRITFIITQLIVTDIAPLTLFFVTAHC